MERKVTGSVKPNVNVTDYKKVKRLSRIHFLNCRLVQFLQ